MKKFKKEKKVDMVEYAERLFLGTDIREAEYDYGEKQRQDDLKEIDNILNSQIFQEKVDKQRQKEMEDFEEERDIERYACFIKAMLSYFCNVNGVEMAKDLFDVDIDVKDFKHYGGGYHYDNFKIMQTDLYRFLGKCDDKRTRAIAKQSMKYLRGEK